MKKWIIPAIIFVVAAIVSYTGYRIFLAPEDDLSYVILDLNPSIMLTLDKSEKVVGVESVNHEADILLSDIDLVGFKLVEVIDKIILELITLGHIDEYSDINVVTVSAIANLENVRQRLEENVITRLTEAAEKSEVNLFTIAMGLNDEMKEDAAENNISNGKMLLINRAINLNPELDKDELINYSIRNIQKEIITIAKKNRDLNREQLMEQKKLIIEENVRQKKFFEEKVVEDYLNLNPNVGDDIDNSEVSNLALQSKKQQLRENFNKIIANFKKETEAIRNSEEEYGENVRNYPIHEGGRETDVNRIIRDIISNELNDPSRVIVLFKNRADRGLIEQARGRVNREFINIPALAVTIPSTALQGLRNNPNVEIIENDMQVNVTAQTKDWGIDRIGVPNSWQSGLTGRGIRIAIVDTGIARHDDLIITGGVAYTTYTTSFHDDNGHGTHVAGIIGARNNQIGTVGIAPEADLFAVKVLGRDGTGYLSDVIAGIDWSINNRMDIINLSLGSPSSSATLERIVDIAYNQDILVVASAGNEGNNAGTGDNVLYPARYNSTIAVAATDTNDNRASFSSTGNTIELSAPGVNVISTHLNNNYVRMSGTSMASPYVAGNIALLRQLYPTLSVRNLRTMLQNNVVDLGTTGRNSLFGYGLIQAFVAEDTNNENIVEPTPTPTPPPPSPPAEPEVTINTITAVSTDKEIYIARERVFITAVVRDENNNLLRGTEVSLIVTTPAGVKFRATNTTNMNGEVTFMYITRGNAVKGAYDVYVQSKYKQYMPSESTMTFQVTNR